MYPSMERRCNNRTKDGFFQIVNGKDFYMIDPPKVNTAYWDQFFKGINLGVYKIYGLEDTPRFLGFVGGPSIILRAGIAARVVANYNPLNPRPLEEVVVNSFRSATYSEIVLEEDLILYRVYGGKAAADKPYWTMTKPSGPLQAVIDSALKRIWEIRLKKLLQFEYQKVRQSTKDIRHHRKGFSGGGGGDQIYIFLKEVDPSWFIH